MSLVHPSSSSALRKSPVPAIAELATDGAFARKEFEK
jgi:hypothetical protein